MKKAGKILCLVMVIIVACVTPKRLNRLTEENLGAKQANYPITYEDYISINTTNLINQPFIAHSVKVKHKFIPAIVYWEWEKNIECTIDPYYTIHLFMEEAMKIATEKNLKNRLEGQKLELTFEEMPNKYLYSHKGFTLVFLFAYSVSDAEHLLPFMRDFKIKYRILKDQQETKSGVITLAHEMRDMHNTSSGTGKFTNAFLEMYKSEVKRLGSEFSKKIVYKI